MTEQVQIDFTQLRRVLPIIWGALLFSVILYGFVGRLVTQESEPGQLAPALQYLFAGLGAVLAYFSIRIRKVTFSPVNVVQKSGARPGKAARQCMTGHLISWVLAESVAIFGLVAVVLAQRFGVGLPFFAASLLLFVFAYPKVDPYQRALENPQIAER